MAQTVSLPWAKQSGTFPFRLHGSLLRRPETPAVSGQQFDEDRWGARGFRI